MANHLRFCMQLALLIAIELIAIPALADVVVVVSPKSPITQLQTHEVADIFLGRTTTVGNGGVALPLDLHAGTAVREDFYRKVTGWTPSLLKAYWSKIIFTGSGQPPREISSPQMLKKLISDNDRYIGYLDSSDVDHSVKVVMLLR
jgi:hypothetical protein